MQKTVIIDLAKIYLKETVHSLLTEMTSASGLNLSDFSVAELASKNQMLDSPT